MNDWINAAEKGLTALFNETGIPYDFERWRVEDKPLPDTYIVYFLVSNPPLSSADGKERSCIVKMQVSLFYKDINQMLSIPQKIKEVLISQGFLRVTEGRIPYQQNTGHYGWRCDFNFYERR